MSSHNTTVAPDDDENYVDPNGTINLTATTNSGVGLVGGVGEHLHTLDFSGATGPIGPVGPVGCVGGITQSSAWSSAGSFSVHDPVPELQSTIEALKAKVEKLEKSESNRKDLEYFQTSLHKALKIPTHMTSPKVHVGTNDILCVHVGVQDIPFDRVEPYMMRVKKDLQSFFEDRGLKGRVLWLAKREETGSRFSVIGVSKSVSEKKLVDPTTARLDMRYNPLSNEDDISFPIRTRPKKAKYPPPVMG